MDRSVGALLCGAHHNRQCRGIARRRRPRAGGRAPAEVDAALARVKAELDAKVQSELEWELAPARRTVTLTNGTTHEKTFSITLDDGPGVVKGRLKWISMDEYLAQPGWDLALDADEAAPWLAAK